MPYTALSSLPEPVKALPKHSQEIWMAAFNNAFKTYNGDEHKAFAVAWAAVNKSREAMHSDFERILSTFIKQYGEEGHAKFENFISLNSLKVDRAYTPQAQFKESFKWVAPLISKYKEDSEAKYWKVIALTANISMNNNPYDDFTKMQQAAPTLMYRPVNMNHDESKWLPFPRTRIDFTKAEDMSVEGTLRVDNQDKWLQDMLPKFPNDPDAKIFQVSIEGRPSPDGIEAGYFFTGLALLEKGVSLPGDPLTEIQPLFLNESVGQAMCRLIDGQVVCNCKTNLRESEKTKMKITEQEKPPEGELSAEKGKCVCAFCGQIDPLTTEEADHQKCSSCGHQMQKLPNQATHTGLQGFEAFGDASFPDSCFAYVPDAAKGADGAKSLRKLPYKNADGTVDIPHVRNALARLDQTDEIPQAEKERIRNMLQNILKSENPDYAPPQSASTQAVMNAVVTEYTVQLNNLKAELVEKEAVWVREKVGLDMAVKAKDEAIIELSEKAATLTRENLNIQVKEEQRKILEAKLSESNSVVERLQGQSEAYARQIGDLEKDRNKANSKNTILNEKVAGLEIENEKIRREYNEESQKRAASETKALNETRERSRIQLENADLRGEVAKTTREISTLTEKLAGDAQKVYAAENEKKALTAKMLEMVAENRKLQETINKAKKFQSWAWRELQKAGLAVVESAES